MILTDKLALWAQSGHREASRLPQAKAQTVLLLGWVDGMRTAMFRVGRGMSMPLVAGHMALAQVFRTLI